MLSHRGATSSHAHRTRGCQVSPYPIDFNPFSRPLNKVRGTDLVRLLEVAEGWFVEYKSEPPRDTMKAVAKSLSAFANQHGGWLIFGVRPKSGKHKVPEDFPGLTESEARDLERDVRNAAQHVSPPVEYRLRTVKGPVEELNLAADRVVLIVQTPEGSQPPYVHSSGYIYRRFDDESRPENDRHQLGLLYERGERRAKKLEDFLRRQPILSKAEKDRPILHLSIMSDPFGDSGHYSEMAFDRFASIMADRFDTRSTGINLENAFMMSEGYVARQIVSRDPYSLGLTWQYRLRDCSSQIVMPLAWWGVGAPDLRESMSGYSISSDFIDALEAARMEAGRVVDACAMFVALISLMNKHRRLTKASGIRGPYFAKARLQNIWRTVPFWDSEKYLEFIRLHGLPVVQDDEAMAPPGIDYDSLAEVPARAFRSDRVMSWASAAKDVGLLFGTVLAALGVPPQVAANEEFLDVGQRYVERAANLALE